MIHRFLRFRDFDWLLFGLVIILCVLSVLEIYSATLHTQFHGFDRMQAVWILAGIFGMLVMSVLDYHWLLDAAHWLYGVAVFSLLAVLVLIVVMARYIATIYGRRLNWRDVFKAIALILIPMVLVLKQPDMGTALTYSPILFAGLFFGGISWKKGLILAVAGLSLIVGVWTSGKILKPYQKARLTSFINPNADPRGTGYQILQSKIAVGDGGVFGRGATHGSQTQGDFLPIPYTDFIFAAYSEEHGFVGAVFVLLIYFLILMRLIQNAQTASDLPGSLLIMGVVATLIFEVTVNIGMVVGLMPVTGIPLPLMSYGGSSVLFTFLALGMVMNVRMSRFVN